MGAIEEELKTITKEPELCSKLATFQKWLVKTLFIHFDSSFHLPGIYMNSSRTLKLNY